jgi:hypothetical protein
VPPRDVGNTVDPGRVTVEVDGHDGARARRDLVLDLGGIDVERHRVDVHEHRPGAGAGDAAGGGEEGERRQQHLVAGADLQGVQGQRHRVGAGGAADAVAGAAVGGDLVLQGGDLGAEDDLPGGQHAGQRRLQLRPQLGVLGQQVTEGDPGGARSCHALTPFSLGLVREGTVAAR